MERRRCLIGRYEAVKEPGGVAVYDTKNLPKDEGDDHPINVIPLGDRVSVHEGCLMAIAWLRDSGLIDQSDYFRHAETFMGADSVDQHAMKQTREDEIRQLLQYADAALTAYVDSAHETLRSLNKLVKKRTVRQLHAAMEQRMRENAKFESYRHARQKLFEALRAEQKNNS